MVEKVPLALFSINKKYVLKRKTNAFGGIIINWNDSRYALNKLRKLTLADMRKRDEQEI